MSGESSSPEMQERDTIVSNVSAIRAARLIITTYPTTHAEIGSSFDTMNNILMDPMVSEEEEMSIQSLWNEMALRSDNTTQLFHALRSRLLEGNLSESEAEDLVREFYIYDFDMFQMIFEIEQIAQRVSDRAQQFSQSQEEEERERERNIPIPTVEQTTLETMAFTELPNNDDGEEEACPICADEYTEEKDILRCPGCRKHMHADCILMWLKLKEVCPLCRHVVKNTTENDAEDDATEDDVQDAIPVQDATFMHGVVSVHDASVIQEANFIDIVSVEDTSSVDATLGSIFDDTLNSTPDAIPQSMADDMPEQTVRRRRRNPFRRLLNVGRRLRNAFQRLQGRSGSYQIN